LTYTIGSVTIPTPANVTKTNPAKVEEFEIDEDLPILIVPGLGAIQLTIEGFLVGDKTILENTYLLPLEALKGTDVTLAFPGTRYNGDWVLADFTYKEVNAKKFTYTIKLLKGSAHIIL
jgi:hypothetical protein